MLHILPAYITSIDPGVNDIDLRLLKFTIGIMSEPPGFVAIFYGGKPLVFPVGEGDISDSEFEGDECRIWQKLGGRVEIIALEIGDDFSWWGRRESHFGSYYLFDLYEKILLVYVPWQRVLRSSGKSMFTSCHRKVGGAKRCPELEQVWIHITNPKRRKLRNDLLAKGQIYQFSKAFLILEFP
jgi:hypothetical protein